MANAMRDAAKERFWAGRAEAVCGERIVDPE
jgi:hypothetical protein